MGELLKDAQGRKADITFERDYTLDLGGVRVRMLVVGPTHTRGDTGIFVEGDGVLFAGDVVMNESFLAAGPGIRTSPSVTLFSRRSSGATCSQGSGLVSMADLPKPSRRGSTIVPPAGAPGARRHRPRSWPTTGRPPATSAARSR